MVVLDLGFHVRRRRRVPAPDREDRKQLVYRRFQALVKQSNDGLHDIRLLLGLDGEPELATAPEGGGSNGDAMGYLFRRLRENRFRGQIVSSRHGKWRRWLADIYFADSDRSLNDELVDRGYAHYWDGRSPKTPGISRMIMEVADQTRGRLSDLAATEGIAPGQVAGRIVAGYFDGDGEGDRN